MNSDPWVEYQAFIQGRAGLAMAVERRLGGLDLPGAPVAVRTGGLNKALIELGAGAGWIKLALHPLSADLLRTEARAYAGPAVEPYGRPEFRLLADDGDWGAAWLSAARGRRPPRRVCLMRRRGPYEAQADGETGLNDHLSALPSSTRLDRWRTRMKSGWPEARLRTGRSHGDFVYWNLLADATGSAMLLDFEYHAPNRAWCFDRCFWTMVPLLRQAGRSGLPVRGLPLWLGVRRYELAAAVAEHAARLDLENKVEGIAALYGEDAMARRIWLLRAYDALMGHLLP